MFKKTETTLSADVATSGTFTVSYPTGTNAGSFSGAVGHKMWSAGHQKMYSNPTGFTLSFASASYITVTYLGTTTLPAGSRVNLQLDMLGTDNNDPYRVRVLNEKIVRSEYALLDLGSPIATDSDGIAASQTVTGAGTAFVINGALASNGAVVFDTPRNVVAAWSNAAVLTITGKDVDGNTVVESSASGTSHTGTKAFKSVSSVTTSATITGATVGTGSKLGLPVFIPDASYIVAELKNGVALPRRPGVVYLCGQITEALLDAGTSMYVVSPVAGAIRKITTVSQGTITTGGTVTAKIATVAVDGGVVTIANSAVAGEIDTATATLGHASTAIAKDAAIELALDSAFNASADLWFCIEIDTTAAGQLSGTFVAGVTSTATATTGDVRGTYTPLTTLDGTAGYKLVVNLPDPGNQGVAQYAG